MTIRFEGHCEPQAKQSIKKAVRYEVDSFFFPLVYLNIKKSKNLTLEKNTNNVQNPDNVPSKQQTKDSC